jgi:DNA-binding NarL/FixJ family response regulator
LALQCAWLTIAVATGLPRRQQPEKRLALQRGILFELRGVTRRLIAEFAGRGTRERPGPAPIDPLTEHEREVTALVAAGLANDVITDRVVVSPATAKTHVSRAMMVRLGARDRAQLVVFAYESRLVQQGTAR